MFGRILYISDNYAYIENKTSAEMRGDLLNLHLIFENGNSKILGEIVELKDNEIEVKLFGEFIEGKYYNGLLRKASLNSNVRVISTEELLELLGTESNRNIVLGNSVIYKGFKICPDINALFANHLCVFGNSGSGKSYGVSRIVQNILGNKNALSYNSNLIFFDSFGEYKNAFKSINTISPYYNYKFITSMIRDEGDYIINIPISLLKVDDIALLLQVDKHSELTMIERAIKYAKIFASNSPEVTQYKNKIIAGALMTILYSQNTARQKKDDIFTLIDTCHTEDFNFDTVITGVGYTRTFRECFAIDSRGQFGEEVLITEYILKFLSDENEELTPPKDAVYTFEDLSNALEFTLISEGFNQNKNMYEDAQLLRVRLNSILHNGIGKFFTGNEYITPEKFITNLVSKKGKKAQIINISLENIDDIYAKALVKIFSRIIYDFAKDNSNRATVPMHLFLEEAHRYIQNDNDIYLLGYNIFDRIAKEGRKYGVMLDIISQRPVDISDTVVSQCSNFLIFKMTHPKDIKYVEEMLPNISQDVIDKMRILQPGTCVAFGSAFKIPMICKLDLPNPRPYSSSCDVAAYWNSDINQTNMLGSGSASTKIENNVLETNIHRDSYLDNFSDVNIGESENTVVNTGRFIDPNSFSGNDNQ